MQVGSKSEREVCTGLLGSSVFTTAIRSIDELARFISSRASLFVN